MFLKYYKIFIGGSGYNCVTVSKFIIKKTLVYDKK